MMIAASGTDGLLAGVPPLVRLGLVVFLVLANGFFVAAEFSLVAVRRSRIDELTSQGDAAARVVQGALKNLDRCISATQLGITLASLGLGWIGEPALAAIVDGLLSYVGLEAPSAVAHSAAAITIAFLIITFLHIVLGELAPKSLALTRPEPVSKIVVRPLLLFTTLAYPGIWLLNGAANRLLRAFGIQPELEHAHVHSADELRLLVTQSGQQGQLNESDTKLLSGVFDFHDKKARDVMRPRTEIVALPLDASPDEIWRVMRAERYSRYPVYGDTLDDVVGVFLAKDLWLHDEGKPFVLSEHVRKVAYVPDTRAAERVLDDLRRGRAHMAVVLDEYGGTSGIVTLEDVIEEVIGDIDDEDDFTTRDAVRSDGVLELAGDLSLADVRADFGLDIPEGHWNTLGGFVFGELGRLAKMGDRVPFSAGELEVVAMDGRRVAAVRVLAKPETTSAPKPGDSRAPL